MLKIYQKDWTKNRKLIKMRLVFLLKLVKPTINSTKFNDNISNFDNVSWMFIIALKRNKRWRIKPSMQM